MKSEVAAIVGGSVAGGLVLIILLSCAIYFICQKKKHKKRREQKKFRPISPHISPAHSQPSTLGHPNEPRLPKVNSTGLWLGAPSVYATGPAPAYVYGRPYGKQQHPLHIQRAASELRLPSQPRVPTPGQRIYHSQQLAPVYEMPPIHTHYGDASEIYDVYQFAGGNSRSKLLESKHSSSYNTEFWLTNRPERSKSDAQDRQHKRRSGEPKRQGSSASKDRAVPIHQSPSRRRAGSKESSRSSNVASSQRVSRSQESLKGVGIPEVRKMEAHTNHGFAPDSATVERSSSVRQQQKVNGSVSQSKDTAIVVSTTAVSSTTVSNALPNGRAGMVSTMVTPTSQSATDSMKLLAKNKTDDQKTIVPPGMVSVSVEKNINDVGNDFKHHHYVYQGDIYAVPSKASSKIITTTVTTNSQGTDDNPILSRMKEMVIEKSRTTSPPTSPRNDSADISNSITADSIIYQEIPGSPRIGDDVLDGLDLPDPADMAKLKDSPRETRPDPPADLPVAPSSSQEQDTGETTSPVVLRPHTQLSPTDSVDTEGAHEDISKAGKRITESAFTFLDKYLSDDEGTDTHVESPPVSPVGLQAQTVGGE